MSRKAPENIPASPQGNPAAEDLEALLLRSTTLYAFLLIPTLWLLWCAGFSDTAISHLMPGTWQAGYWEFPWLSKTASRVILDVAILAVTGGITWFFYQGYRVLRKAPPEEANATTVWKTVLRWTVVSALLLLAVIPFHSSDIYGYLNRGFQQSVFAANPYLVTVGEIPGWQHSPLLHDHWIYNPCPYGFFFALVAAGLTGLSNAHFMIAFLLFKSMNVLLLGGSTWLVYDMARRLNHHRPVLTAYLFGANPLVLLHAMGNGHNDIMMVFLLLASLWTLLETRLIWACLPLLALSVLTKYASLLALPFVLIYLVKNRQWPGLFWGGLLTLALCIGLGSVYVDPHQPWPWSDMLDNAGKPQHSILSAIGRLVYYVADIFGNRAKEAMDLVLRVLKPLCWGGFVLFYGTLAVRYLWRKTADFQGLLWCSGLSLAVMVGAISAKFHPWYVVMFLPVLLLLPEESRLRRFGILLSVFQIAAFSLLQNVHILGVLLLTGLPIWLTLRPFPRWKKPVN